MIVTVGEDQKHLLYKLSQFRNPTTYMQQLRAVELLRPMGIRARFFEPKVVDRLFKEYRRLASEHGDASPELKFGFYYHVFAKDPENIKWPWSSWLAFSIGSVPIALRPSSASRQFLRSADAPEATKRKHLIETVDPILKFSNMIIYSPRASRNSWTHQQLRGHLGSLCQEQEWPSENPRLRIMILGRSQTEIELLNHPKSLELWSRVGGLWGGPEPHEAADPFFYLPFQFL